MLQICVLLEGHSLSHPILNRNKGTLKSYLGPDLIPSRDKTPLKNEF